MGIHSPIYSASFSATRTNYAQSKVTSNTLCLWLPEVQPQRLAGLARFQCCTTKSLPRGCRSADSASPILLNQKPASYYRCWLRQMIQSMNSRTRKTAKKSIVRTRLDTMSEALRTTSLSRRTDLRQILAEDDAREHTAGTPVEGLRK